jgi:hypothetical protein
MNLFKWFGSPNIEEVPSLEGRPLSFNDVCTSFFPGLVNVGRPRVGDVLIVAETCGMGVSIRRERRVRVTGRPFEKTLYDGSVGGGSYEFVPTDGGDFALQDLRRMKDHPRFWIIVR